MRNLTKITVVTLVLSSSLAVRHVPSAPDAGRSLEQLAHLAISEDASVAASAQAQLRRTGQPGLDALFETFPKCAARSTGYALPADLKAQRWRAAVEAVSRQRDASFSRLYWYTDLEHARDAAAQSGRRILSLRLLGNLDEEKSCANSRYFRTVLYANPAVADYLRENFILHWQSVRPVPTITIDLGDGRLINRTITGNSIHYVLANDGSVLDAIPGLWSADAFLRVLRDRSPSRDAESIASNPMTPQIVEPLRQQQRPGNLPAADAGALAFAKARIEMPMVRQLADGTLDVIQPLAGRASISERSRRLMWQKRYGTDADLADPQQCEQMKRLTTDFERVLAADTRLNRLMLRPRATAMIEAMEDSTELDTLNQRIYAELFRTPLDDPWMGLVPEHSYAALENEGLTEPMQTSQR